MDPLFLLAIVTVAIVLVFDYTNGFHDAANIVATVIASRAMTPAQAVIIVGVFEFLGPLLGGTAVANTIGKFITLDGVAPVLALSILLCGLIGAIVWNLATWYFGIPSSSSHALIGGLIGAAGGALQAASRTLKVRQADPAHMTEGFGLYALIGKATAFLAPLLIAVTTQITGTQAMGIVPIIVLFLLGLVLLPWVKSSGAAFLAATGDFML